VRSNLIRSPSKPKPRTIRVVVGTTVRPGNPNGIAADAVLGLQLALSLPSRVT
jgi:hypothetical protein